MAKKKKSNSHKKPLSKNNFAQNSPKRASAKKKSSNKNPKKPKESSKKQSASPKKSKTSPKIIFQKAKSPQLKKKKTAKRGDGQKVKIKSERKSDYASKNQDQNRIALKTDRANENLVKPPVKTHQSPTVQVSKRNQDDKFDISKEDPGDLNLKSTHPASFIAKQKNKLEELRDALLDQMADVAHDSLRAASENGGGAAFGQHMGDAGSEAYERDFALSLLSQEQDSLYEINEALRRIEMGTYGMCEKSGKPIPKERLEAIPWARYTVECQKNLEKNNIRRNRWESTPQFMDSLDNEEETEEEDSDDESRVKSKE